MTGHDIITVGASAGGVEALIHVAESLPPDLQAAVFMALHVSPASVSALPRILSRAGPLQASHPQDGERIRAGHIYVAPPDRHMLIDPGVIRISRGPRENGHRPAIDPLFRSAALAYSSRVVGVVLSGTLDDGTEGLGVIKSRGGVAIVQDPAGALFPSMPASAAQHVSVDYCLPIGEIGAVLAELAPEKSLLAESDSASEGSQPGLLHVQKEGEGRGIPSVFTCPDCGGTLWEVERDGVLHFHCRVGHAFSGDTLFQAQDSVVEEALWSAVRALEERADLARRLADRAKAQGYAHSAATFGEQAAQSEHRANMVRGLLMNGIPQRDEGALGN